MVTVKCQHSGIEFEAKSTRTKQHPLVAEFKNEAASKRGDYSLAVQALDKAAEIGGYETIKDYMQLVNDIYTGAYDAKREIERNQNQEQRKAEQDWRDAKAKREATNRHLREHGYKWNKEYRDTAYGAGWGEDDSQVWRLYSPDGRVVTVEQALDEIERGADVILAEIEATEQAEATRQDEAETKSAEFDAAWNEAQNRPEVERFDTAGAEIVTQREWMPGQVNKIGKIQVNGVTCYWTHRASPDGDIDRFFCDDPEMASLNRVERSGLSKTLADFWG